jgi:hypothetical protein
MPWHWVGRDVALSEEFAGGAHGFHRLSRDLENDAPMVWKRIFFRSFHHFSGLAYADG